MCIFEHLNVIGGNGGVGVLERGGERKKFLFLEYFL
jgi:hypothetical protein